MPGPSTSAHQVLVYSGPGVSPLSLSHTVLTLSLLLLPHYTVQPITPSTLATQPWEQACALLVVPGGRDLPYVDELSVKTKVTKRIKEYVEAGGRYLGICAGAYFGSETVIFDQGGDMEVVGKRFHYAAESGSKAVSLILKGSRTIDHLYYNGGGHFILPPTPDSNTEILATYSDSDKIAAVSTKIGQGRSVLCSVHFEYPLNDPPCRDAIKKLSTSPSSEDIEQSEKERIEWATEILSLLGLKPPKRSSDEKDHLALGEEDPELLLHPTHPSPIFVFNHSGLPELGTKSFEASALRSKIAVEDGKEVLRDGNDELQITTIDSIAQEGGETEVAAYLGNRRRSKPKIPPSMSELSIEPSESTPEPPQLPDLNAIAKTILLPSQSVAYSPRWTPLFNMETYWSELDRARKGVGRKSGVLRDGKSALGDLVWYAEAITSTQTILDRNPLLLTSLPTPLVCTASFQLSGRGRGSNVWLSPPGCLQYSILLTLPSSMSSKIVFIQYLAALAICEAVDEDGRLGVRIKWPNDIYAEVEGVGATEIGSGKKGKAKLGGILVNTNFIGGQWRIVVGCGVNVLNALPTTSLSQLHSLLSARDPTPTKPLPPTPTMEGTFAKIMTIFEQKWEQFIEEKGFHRFLDEYYARWLHTNQEVTLTTVEPHQRLKIHSITPDYGLLRCEPLDKPKASNGLTPLYSRGDYGDDDRFSSSTSKTSSKNNGGDDRFVDLQPDGNSFDLMAGLIKRKT